MVFASIFTSTPALIGFGSLAGLVIIGLIFHAIADRRLHRLSPNLLDLRDKMNTAHRWHFCVRGAYPSKASRTAFETVEATRDKAMQLYKQGKFDEANSLAAEGLAQLDAFRQVARTS